MLFMSLYVVNYFFIFPTKLSFFPPTFPIVPCTVDRFAIEEDWFTLSLLALVLDEADGCDGAGHYGCQGGLFSA